MAVSQLTEDAGIDVSFNEAPEYTLDHLPINRFGSIGASVRLMGFVAQTDYEISHLSCAPTTIASGTLKVDLLVEGVSVCTTPATATEAIGGVATGAVFATTRIAEGDTVIVATTADSDTVTDVMGQLIIRPLLGHERVE